LDTNILEQRSAAGVESPDEALVGSHSLYAIQSISLSQIYYDLLIVHHALSKQQKRYKITRNSASKHLKVGKIAHFTQQNGENCMCFVQSVCAGL